MPETAISRWKKWWRPIATLVAVIGGIAAFSGDLISIRENFGKLFGTKNYAVLSFSLQSANINKVVVFITNTGAQPENMLAASLDLNNPDSVWHIPLVLHPDNKTISGNSMKVFEFIVPDDIGGEVQIDVGNTPETNSRCFLSVTLASLSGGKELNSEISCGALAFLLIGLQTKIHEWRNQH
jgi:hypothetical protein